MRRFHYEITDSTNTQARTLSAVHPGEMLLVSAAEQSSGRGRHGRVWQSPRGGAWMSVVWPLHKTPAEYVAASLVAAVAVVRALQQVAPQRADDLQIKWPNDVLLGGDKVAGILCELCPGGGERGPGSLILGVGINAAFDLGQLQGRLRHPATTLQAAGEQAVAVEEIIEEATRQLVQAMTDFETDGLSHSLLNELRSRLAYVDDVRRWAVAGGSVTGCVRGVDDAGRLLLDTGAGVAPYASGELLADVDASAEDLA
jgi:BirA family biotin operon repressor/biotin-[acetyl-CoA-carboxylase] ligase